MGPEALENFLKNFEIVKQSDKKIKFHFTLSELEILLRGLYELGDDEDEKTQKVFQIIAEMMDVLARQICVERGDFGFDQGVFGSAPVMNCYSSLIGLKPLENEST